MVAEGAVLLKVFVSRRATERVSRSRCKGGDSMRLRKHIVYIVDWCMD